MPFQKGNKLWRKSLASRHERQDKIDKFLATLASTGMERYAEIMDKLADGEEITKAEREYMDRLEGWREYVKPKLARTEHTGKDGKDLKGFFSPDQALIVLSNNGGNGDGGTSQGDNKLGQAQSS